MSKILLFFDYTTHFTKKKANHPYSLALMLTLPLMPSLSAQP